MKKIVLFLITSLLFTIVLLSVNKTYSIFTKRVQTSLEVTTPKLEAVFLPGTEFNIKIKQIAGDNNPAYNTDNTSITSIVRSNVLTITPTIDNIVSTSDSSFPIYVWFSSGVLYYYTEVEHPYLNEDSHYMFRNLSSLNLIDISSINTSRVVNMGGMFQKTGLQSIDLSSFDTSNVEIVQWMFAYSNNLQNIDISSFDMSKVLYTDSMLSQTPNLKELRTPKVYPNDTSVVIALPETMYNTNMVGYDSLGKSTNPSSPLSTLLKTGYTITYDYNYLPNNAFSNIFTGRGLNYTTFNEENYFDEYGSINKMTATSCSLGNDNKGACGFYYIGNSSSINTDNITVMFDVKADKEVTLYTWIEGTNNNPTPVIGTNWQRIAYTTNNPKSSIALIFYGWATTYPTTLYVRNLQVQGGNLYTTSSEKLYTDNLETLDTPTRNGYTFLGWYTAAIGGTKINSSSPLPSTDTTYYAHWAKTVNNYAYNGTAESSGSVQVFTAPTTGIYKLETWGAQGGSDYNESKPAVRGGFGGYSTGTIVLNESEKLYIFVGEEGKMAYAATEITESVIKQAYPNGGAVEEGYSTHNIKFNGGGGSTHIAKTNQLIKDITPGSDNLIMVAGGGGGISNYWNECYDGGSGGGYIGASTIGNFSNINATGGTQNSVGLGGGNQDGHDRSTGWLAGAYGVGGGRTTYQDASSTNVSGGGGGGYYGGGASWGGPGAGGSGYIANSNLNNKSMYCYDCPESLSNSTQEQKNIFTVSTTGTSSYIDTVTCPDGYSADPVSKCAKSGDGYARITLITQGETWEYSYNGTDGSNGSIQVFDVPVSGTYKLETWGASGGYAYDSTRSTGGGGYGGYSTGIINLSSNDKLYLAIGGQGESNCETRSCFGGYNGGSASSKWANGTGAGLYTGGGGGATHISLDNGLLKDLSQHATDNRILIVSGGGGGGDYYPDWNTTSSGGSGGGYTGGYGYHSTASGYTIFGPYATQNTGYAFGTAGTTYITDSAGGSGGGYYGGYSYTDSHATGTGGSGYIGNANLINKVMYCYNCVEELTNANTFTISTTGSNKDASICPNGYSADPVSKCAKLGNGYAKITLISTN